MDKKMFIALSVALLALSLSCGQTGNKLNNSVEPPNIIFVMVDDMGYGDLGCYGQTEIKTPNIGHLASEGIRFTNFYSGSPVCAPARSVLMTGEHTGHTTVRGNFGIGGVTGLGGGEGRVPLKKEDVTIAEILKKAGYVTGMTGKWGLGEPETTGLPNDKGFDEWFGYLNQRRAHNHYADYIWLNREKYPIPENADGQKNKYTHNMFTEFALDFIKKHANGEQPFFLYVPYLLPHGAFEIPEINPLYRNKDWSDQEKVYASMISLIDVDMGKIRALLKERNILGNTLVIFTSDNGAANRYESRFNSSGILRGRKRDVYEGGLRVPLLVSMPGLVPQEEMNQSVGYFADILPTFAELAGVEIPVKSDGISLKDAFLKNEYLAEERTLYWEFHEQEGKQAVRLGNWKGVRLDVHKRGFHDEIELYDLHTDPAERNDIADEKPEIVNRLKEIMVSEHEFSENFPFNFEKYN
ncbi:MAG TPA: arylsulfatase [Bacteroidales bacterium]|nr:arylsulfatase [Bacteroidales bacterium]